MREQVVDYYNNEIVDNLIRGRNGQPFVHVDVIALSANAASKISGSVGGGETTTHTTTTPALAAANALTTVARVAARPFTYSVTPERSDTLTITSAPVTGTKEIYELYLKFLNLNPSNKDLDKSSPSFAYLGHCASVQQACTLKNRLHLNHEDYVPGTLRERNGCLYYVPICYQASYLELCRGLLSVTRPKPSTLINATPVITQ